MNLPRPECRYGFTGSQIAYIMGPRLSEFRVWMRGQTVSSCDGREYDYKLKDYVPTGCGPHGVVVYSSDVERFLRNQPIVD